MISGKLGGMTTTEYLVWGGRLTAGLLAGLFFSFAVAVMPAFRGLGDAAFVSAMNRINVAIVTPIFVVVFFATPVLAVVAGVLLRSPLAYAAAGLGVITLLITLAVNIPLNNQLAAGGARTAFENRWVLWNVLRTFTGAGSFGCLLLMDSTPR